MKDITPVFGIYLNLFKKINNTERNPKSSSVNLLSRVSCVEEIELIFIKEIQADTPGYNFILRKEVIAEAASNEEYVYQGKFKTGINNFVSP